MKNEFSLVLFANGTSSTFNLNINKGKKLHLP